MRKVMFMSDKYIRVVPLGVMMTMYKFKQVLLRLINYEQDTNKNEYFRSRKMVYGRAPQNVVS